VPYTMEGMMGKTEGKQTNKKVTSVLEEFWEKFRKQIFLFIDETKRSQEKVDQGWPTDFSRMASCSYWKLGTEPSLLKLVCCCMPSLASLCSGHFSSLGRTVLSASGEQLFFTASSYQQEIPLCTAVHSDLWGHSMRKGLKIYLHECWEDKQ
jgi:hypothetical protein